MSRDEGWCLPIRDTTPCSENNTQPNKRMKVKCNTLSPQSRGEKRETVKIKPVIPQGACDTGFPHPQTRGAENARMRVDIQPFPFPGPRFKIARSQDSPSFKKNCCEHV